MFSQTSRRAGAASIGGAVAILLAAPSFGQQQAEYPVHFPELVDQMSQSFGNVASYVEDAQTITEFTTGYATGLAEVGVHFSTARFAVEAEVASVNPGGASELADMYELASTGFTLTAFELLDGDVWTAAGYWSSTQDVVSDALELITSSYAFPDVDDGVADLLDAMAGMEDSLRLLQDPAGALTAFDPFAEFLAIDPNALIQATSTYLANTSPEMLEQVGMSTPEDIDELLALGALLVGTTEIDQTVALAQADPIAWLANLTLVALSQDFVRMAESADALHEAIPTGIIQIAFSAGGEECVDLCSSDSNCPSTREYGLGTANWGPKKFEKAVNKAKAALDAAGGGAGLVGGPGKLVKEILKGGSQGIKGLKGLNKLISAARPVPYFRLCRPQCKSTWCPGTWWIQFERYKRCTGRTCTKWKRLSSPPMPTPENGLAGNPFVQLDSWLTTSDIDSNPDAFDDAVEVAADEAIEAAGGEDAFWSAND